MSEVKRYMLINGLLRLSDPPSAIEEAIQTHALFTGEKQVVLAADYDALAAELTETQRLDSVIVRDLSARIAQLEAALREVHAVLQSDSVEYDDISALMVLIDEALAPKEST